MNPLKRLASDTAIYGLSTIVARLINYLLVAYHTRVLDRAQYGVFTEFYSYAALLLVLLTYGMETGFFRFASRSDQRPNSVFSTAIVSLFITSSLFFAVVAGNVEGISAWMGYASNPDYLLQMAAVIALDAFIAVPFARLRFLRKAKLFAAFKLLNVVFYVLVSVAFFTFLPDYFELHPDSFWLRYFSPKVSVAYVFVANLCSSLLSLVLLLPTIFGVRFSFSPSLLRRMLAYSLPLLVAGLPGIANDYLDRLMFRWLYDDPAFALDQLGVYGANAKLAVLMLLFVQMFRYAAEPFFFSQANKSDFRKMFADVMTYFVALAMLIFLFVSLNLELFSFFTGKDFREGVAVVPLMLFANLLLGIVFNLSMWYKLSEKTGYAVFITLSGMLVTLLVNLLCIPRYGYIAAAWAHCASYAVMVLISYAMGQKFYPIRYNLRAISLYILVGLGIYAIFAAAKHLLGAMPMLPQTLLATALILAYAALVWWKDGRKLLSGFAK
jgi:O-antigen/teichoic acid export membrane protein